MFIPKHVKLIKTKEKGLALLANKNFKKGEVIFSLKGEKIVPGSKAGPDAVQIGPDKFLDSKHRYAEDHINHSCNPTTKIDFDIMKFVALKNIKKGEEITFDYDTTEYDLVKEKEDFDCKCHSKNCRRRVQGFKHLSLKEKKKIKNMLSPYLKRMLEKEIKKRKLLKK